MDSMLLVSAITSSSSCRGNVSLLMPTNFQGAIRYPCENCHHGSVHIWFVCGIGRSFCATYEKALFPLSFPFSKFGVAECLFGKRVRSYNIFFTVFHLHFHFIFGRVSFQQMLFSKGPSITVTVCLIKVKTIHIKTIIKNTKGNFLNKSSGGSW